MGCDKPGRRRAAIAIVDDDDDVRVALAEMAASLGYDAVGFATADALLGAAAIDRVDCIISDMHMPGTNGLTLARVSRDRGTPLILITAFPSPELERQAAEAGVACLLRKPFDPARLVDQLSTLLH